MIDESTLDLLAMVLIAVVVGAAVPLALAWRRGRTRRPEPPPD